MNLEHFISRPQLAAIYAGMRGEEKQFFIDKIVEVQNVIQAMPETYETDGIKEKVAQLHYFFAGMDWYIIEKDSSDEQLQAFGWADLGHGGELGYISIAELIKNNVELDLHFEPKLLSECVK